VVFCDTSEFNAGNLLRVVPVAQRLEVGGVGVAILSLELYRSGFIAVVRTDAPSRPGVMPCNPRWIGQDNTGGTFRSCNSGGSGIPGPPGVSTWRLDVFFAPAIDPATTRLQLQLDELRTETLRPDPDHPGRAIRDAAHGFTGPWVFDVDLDATDQQPVTRTSL
jgi:hypothetical protein